MWMERVAFVKCKSTELVADLQDTIEEAVGIPVHRQRIFYNDRFLDDDQIRIQDLRLIVKRPNTMVLEDQSAVDWLAERKRMFKSLEEECLVPLPPAAARLVELKQLASKLDNRLKLIFDEVSADGGVSAPSSILLEELQAIMPGVCADFRSKLEDPQVLATFQALAGDAGTVPWEGLQAWWARLVTDWERASAKPFSRTRIEPRPVPDAITPSWRAIRTRAEVQFEDSTAAGPRPEFSGGHAHGSSAARRTRSLSDHASVMEAMSMAEWPDVSDTFIPTVETDASEEAVRVLLCVIHRGVLVAPSRFHACAHVPCLHPTGPRLKPTQATCGLALAWASPCSRCGGFGRRFPTWPSRRISCPTTRASSIAMPSRWRKRCVSWTPRPVGLAIAVC